MFIVCGVLYAVDRTDARETKIRLALDLYKHNMIEIELPFTNPFRHTTMLGYNPRQDPRDGTGRWDQSSLSRCPSLAKLGY